MKLSLVVLCLWMLASTLIGQTVTVTEGGVYAGNSYTSVTVATNSPVTFYECNFAGPDTLLAVSNGQNVTCQGCTFRDAGPHAYGTQAARGIVAMGAAKLYLLGCDFNGLDIGVWEDAEWSSPDVFYWDCTFEHNNLRYADGAGGWLNSGGWGFAVCFMQTKGYNSGSHKFQIDSCSFFNLIGVDEPGDQINVYESSGLICSDCRIQGAKGVFCQFGQNANGIVTDDPWSDTHTGEVGDFDWTTSNCVFQGNKLIDASIGIWAGHDNVFKGNTVVNSGIAANGQPIRIVGVGRYAPEGEAWAKSNVVTGNRVSSVFEGRPLNYENPVGPVNWASNIDF